MAIDAIKDLRRFGESAFQKARADACAPFLPTKSFVEIIEDHSFEIMRAFSLSALLFENHQPEKPMPEPVTMEELVEAARHHTVMPEYTLNEPGLRALLKNLVIQGRLNLSPDPTYGQKRAKRSIRLEGNGSLLRLTGTHEYAVVRHSLNADDLRIIRMAVAEMIDDVRAAAVQAAQSVVCKDGRVCPEFKAGLSDRIEREFNAIAA